MSVTWPCNSWNYCTVQQFRVTLFTFCSVRTRPCNSSKYLTGQQFIETGLNWPSVAAAEKALNSQECLITVNIVGWVINLIITQPVIKHFGLSNLLDCCNDRWAIGQVFDELFFGHIFWAVARWRQSVLHTCTCIWAWRNVTQTYCPVRQF